MEFNRVLIFGAGVLGSVYAAKFHEAGVDVTVVARGKRLEDIREHGIVIKEFKSGEQTTSLVKVVGEMPADEYFDICIVPIQRTHVESALPDLSSNKNIPCFLFMHNTVTGFKPLIKALGRERVMIGHANLGGERNEHIVHYMVSQEMTLGELDGEESERLKEIASVFENAGFSVEFSKNIDSWKRYHMAFGLPMVNAMYMAGSCNYKLAKNKEARAKFIRGMREGFDVLEELGYPVEPKKMSLLASLPDFLLMPLFKMIFNMEIMDIGGARHARNARGEMIKLGEDFLGMAEKAGKPVPTLRKLHSYALEPNSQN